MCTKTGGCTKKELVEWLEANVPDDAEVMVYLSDTLGHQPLDCKDVVGLVYSEEENKVYL